MWGQRKRHARRNADGTVARYLQLAHNRWDPKANRAQAVRAAERLDGKYLVPTSDDTLSAEDVALGYRQLLQVETVLPQTQLSCAA